ncbi:MAG TPA: low molecular weight phosphatase family protein, partial [Candidatus Tectomicrobia bacterium]
VNNTGPISRTVLRTLRDLGVDVEVAARYPMQVQEHELQQAQLIIALQEAEHRPYLHARYPAWVEAVEYWHVRDLDPTPAYNPLQEIATEVRRLILRLANATPPA